MNKEILKKLSYLYKTTEENVPPNMTTLHERSYNNGFYQGQLKALESVCQDVFGITGDDLPES
jgi:hypothetical protein